MDEHCKASGLVTGDVPARRSQPTRSNASRFGSELLGWRKGGGVMGIGWIGLGCCLRGGQVGPVWRAGLQGVGGVDLEAPSRLMKLLPDQGPVMSKGVVA